MIKARIVTFGLMALNIGIYLWMVATGTHFFLPNPQELFIWGGSSSDALMQGEWWRLISCMFLHSGILHLAMNMYALYYIGSLLEPTIGKSWFLIAYFATGILASLTSALFQANNYIVGVGASGAIFGLFGMLFALLTTKFFVQEIRDTLTKTIVTTFTMNIVYSFQGGIDIAAHAGGLISGLLIGYCFYSALVFSEKYFTIGAFSLIPLLALGATSLSINYLRSTDAFSFETLKNDILSTEEELDQRGRSMALLPEWQVGIYLEGQILPEWERRKALADQMNQLRLSGAKAKMRNYLVEFIYLQAEKLDLLAKSINENSNAYDSRISAINNLILPPIE